MTEAVFCSCGFPNQRSALFCGQCGHRLAGSPDTAWTQAGERSAAPDYSTGLDSGTPVEPTIRVPPRLDVPGDRVHETVSPDGAGPLDALVGEAAPNATYLGQRLLYEKIPEAPFDPVTNPRYLAELSRQFAVAFVVGVFGLVVGAVVPLILGFFLGFKAGVLLWLLLEIAVGVYWIVFWFRPVPALLSEWKLTVDGKGTVSAAALEHMAWSLRERRTPVRSVTVRRLELPGGQTRDALVLQDGAFAGHVTCFPYGRDLYICWTFWLHLSPARWLWTVVTRTWWALTGRGSRIYVSLDYEPARAMREVLHAVARQGVDVAAGFLTPQGRGTIGSAVPVDATRQDDRERGMLPSAAAPWS